MKLRVQVVIEADGDEDGWRLTSAFRERPVPQTLALPLTVLCRMEGHEDG